MKHGKDKSMDSGPNKAVLKPLVCIVECDVPGWGFFEKGKVVTDRLVIDHLTANGSHPNFVNHEEEK
jgi:hypothetical protein